MKFAKLNQETWAIYEALRRFGFEDDQIGHVVGPTEWQGKTIDDVLSVVLNVTPRFVVTVGKLDRPLAEVRAELDRLREAIRDGTIRDSELQAMWESSTMGDIEQFQSLALSILMKGIQLPAAPFELPPELRAN